MAPALIGIITNSISPKPPIQSKSTCHPPTPQDWAETDRDGLPGRVKARGVAGELKKEWGME